MNPTVSPDPELVAPAIGAPADAEKASITEVLGSGHLLTWEGHGHTAYGTSDCVTKLADHYLVTLELPEEGTRCKA